MEFIEQQNLLVGFWYNQSDSSPLKEVPISPIKRFGRLGSRYEMTFDSMPIDLKTIWQRQPLMGVIDEDSYSSLIFGWSRLTSPDYHDDLAYAYTTPVYITRIYYNETKGWVVIFRVCNSVVTYDQLEAVKLDIQHKGRGFSMDANSIVHCTTNDVIGTHLSKHAAREIIEYSYISSTTGITERYGQRVILPQISDIFYNDPYTTVKWMDGTVTTVKVKDGEQFDKEFGLAMAIAKKYGEAYRKDHPRSAFKALVNGGTDITKAVKDRRARKEAKKKLRESEKKD